MLKEIFFEFNGYSVVIRLLLSVVVGGLIGKERARHGRAAGMRTHILVCLGSALTALCGTYCVETLGYSSDAGRLSAQVISGIGFLGAGMILVKNNSVIVGLTTAAGMWTTAAVGIALGFGFYTGAFAVTILCLITTVLLARFEKNKKYTEIVYVELDDMYDTNAAMERISAAVEGNFRTQVTAPKSGAPGHIGIELIMEDSIKFDVSRLKEISGVVFTLEE